MSDDARPWLSQTLTHGVHYVSRDEMTVWNLDRFLAGQPHPGSLPRPERDVLASLLRFCLDGLAHLDAREEALLLPTAAPVLIP